MEQAWCPGAAAHRVACAGHVAAIGGVARIAAEVAPAVIQPVGALTYVQLTGSIDTALTPEAGAKRRALEALMAPILVGARCPADSRRRLRFVEAA